MAVFPKLSSSYPQFDKLRPQLTLPILQKINQFALRLVGGGRSNLTQDLSYQISAVESQGVAGMNYRIAQQKKYANPVKYTLFNVFVNLGEQATVRPIQWIDFSGFSVAEVIQNYNDSLQLHARLQGSNLIRIENIRRNEGLPFRFQRESQYKSVFIFKKDGRFRNLIY